MKKIIIGNWKMNGGFEQTDQWMDNFFDEIENNNYQMNKIELVICPPVFLIDYIDSEIINNGFTALETMMNDGAKNFADLPKQQVEQIVMENRPFKIGAQDCHFEDSGAYTGSVSAAMIKELGAQYVIIGHSERRVHDFENDEIISKKVRAAVRNKLIPIICVGETKEIRQQEKHLEYIYRQLVFSLPKDIKFDEIIIAYEPVWSIGTKELPTSAQILEIAKLIKKIMDEKLTDNVKKFSIIYGGSVNSTNSREILEIDYIDGLLVGKASLDAAEFLKIAVI